MRQTLAALAFWFLGTSVQADTREPFFFRSSDRVLFLGDSITEQYEYSTYIELYLTTRFPKWAWFS